MHAKRATKCVLSTSQPSKIIPNFPTNLDATRCSTSLVRSCMYFIKVSVKMGLSVEYFLASVFSQNENSRSSIIVHSNQAKMFEALALIIFVKLAAEFQSTELIVSFQSA
eukprot:Pompholyxophrys_punicea_v1_NODE_2071_length_469_cov_1.789855.p1 type:complete len:110 gc:universal NODE_2071_length_469_cov_1.789855:424-95(-)